MRKYAIFDMNMKNQDVSGSNPFFSTKPNASIILVNVFNTESNVF